MKRFDTIGEIDKKIKWTKIYYVVLVIFSIIFWMITKLDMFYICSILACVMMNQDIIYYKTQQNQLRIYMRLDK